MNHTFASTLSVIASKLPDAVLNDVELSAHVKREEERISHQLAMMSEAQSVDSLKKGDAPSFTWEEVEDPLAKAWYDSLRRLIQPTAEVPAMKVGWYATTDGEPCMYFYGDIGANTYYILPGMQGEYDHLMRKVDCLERMRTVNLVDARGTHPKADINCTPLHAILIKHVLGR